VVRAMAASRGYGRGWNAMVEETTMVMEREFKYSRRRAPRSGFSDWPAQRKTTKKTVGR
jgi:hypothetical protein